MSNDSLLLDMHKLIAKDFTNTLEEESISGKEF